MRCEVTVVLPKVSGRLLVSVLLAGLLAPGCKRTPAANARSGPAPADPTLGTPATDAAARSATQYAQAFYDWYRVRGDKYESAIRDSPSAFEPVLLGAMRADLDAQSHSPDEVVGLDWDPLLATQDPCDPYRVQGTTRRGDTILVSMKGTCADRAPQAGPDVIAEIGRLGDRWVFLDFRHAGDPGSLRQDLTRLREERASAARRR
jgi:hypothetical protein